LIVFGGREGDGKKRIVNDLFIFDTGKFKCSLNYGQRNNFGNNPKWRSSNYPNPGWDTPASYGTDHR
jgi:hypothetical protein